MKPIEDTFQHCPQCGQKAVDLGSNPFHCHACDYVYYFSPTAAVGGIVTDGNKVLFLVREKDPGKGKLGIPGGFVDVGETLEESLRREVLEEASLEVVSTRYLCSFPNQYIYRGVKIDVTDAFFVCRVESFGSLVAQEGEVQEFRWLEPNAATLDNLAFQSNRYAIETYLKQRDQS